MKVGGSWEVWGGFCGKVVHKNTGREKYSVNRVSLDELFIIIDLDTDTFSYRIFLR